MTDDEAYAPRDPVTEVELLVACEILLHAGFKEEALLVLTHLVGNEAVEKLLKFKDEVNGGYTEVWTEEEVAEIYRRSSLDPIMRELFAELADKLFERPDMKKTALVKALGERRAKNNG